MKSIGIVWSIAAVFALVALAFAVTSGDLALTIFDALLLAVDITFAVHNFNKAAANTDAKAWR